jgi:hypothetical protein
MVEVYSTPLKKRFYAPVVSISYAFKVLYYVGLFVLPFMLASASPGFWKTQETRYEQPYVEYMHKVILQAEGESGEFLLWSTIPEYNSIVGKSRVRYPAPISSREIDHDLDGKADQFELTLTLPLKSGEKVHRFSALVFFNYQLQTHVRLDMESSILLQAESALPGSAVNFYGDLRFHQDNAIPSKGVRDAYAGVTIDPTELDTVQDVQFPALLKQVMERNETTSFDGVSHWTSGEFGSFTVKLLLDFPATPIRYVPDSAEVIKFALAQYIGFFAMVFVLCTIVREFVYTNQIFETRMQVDMSLKQKKYTF